MVDFVGICADVKRKREKKVGTIKSAVGRIVIKSKEQWKEVVRRVVLGNQRRTIHFETSPFDLLHGAKPKLVLPELYGMGMRPLRYCESKLQALLAP